MKPHKSSPSKVSSFMVYIALHMLFLVADRLSGYGGINVGLPPASPSEGDLMITVS